MKVCALFFLLLGWSLLWWIPAVFDRLFLEESVRANLGLVTLLCSYHGDVAKLPLVGLRVVFAVGHSGRSTGDGAASPTHLHV